MSTPQPPSLPQDPEPWPHPREDDPGTPYPDVLVSPAEAARDGRPRRRRPLVLAAAATAVALVLGGVAYAGTRLWYGSGAEPESATPSGVAAFARLDLSPGFGQRLTIEKLLKKFPRSNGKDTIDGLKRGVFDGLDVDETSYRRNVQPWFADRVGVALWMDATKRPYTLIMLAARDESAARTGLSELQRGDGADKFGFAVRNGYALVAQGDQDAQAAAEAAGRDARRESLAASDRFRTDTGRLPARQAALAWGDLAKVQAVMRAATEEALADTAPGFRDTMPPSSPMLGGGLLSPGLGGLAPVGGLKGRVVVGAQATDNGVEIRYRGFGTAAAAQPANADARSTVDSLPANSIVAGSLRVGDLGGAFSGLIPDANEAIPEEALKDLSPAEAAQARKEMRQSRKRFEAVDKAFAALSAARISVAVTGTGGAVPALRATADTASADSAATLAGALKSLGDGMTITTSGDTVEVRTRGYAADRATLAGQALYREALDGTPENATTVLYVDVQRLLADTGPTDKDRRWAKAVKAVGLATGTEDGDLVGLVRLVVR